MSEFSENCSKCVSIHWFRHGLRLHDNPALLEALEDCNKFHPVFILDGEVAGTKTAGYNRMRFLHECLEDLDSQIKKFGGRLFVFKGSPIDIFTKLFEEWGVTKLTFEQDPEPIWQDRDSAVRNLCRDKGVECVEKISHTLWDPRRILKENGGNPPHTYALFNQVTSALGEPERPVNFPKFDPKVMVVPENFEEIYELPSLKELGCHPECDEQLNRINEWKGGESKGLKLFGQRIKVEENAFRSGYVMPNQYHPDMVGPPLSMSPHLRFGCLSIRKFYWEIKDTYDKICPNEPNLSLMAQIAWREYFYTMSLNNIKYDQMEGNPICLQIPWKKDDEKLKQWATGKTGFPWIDACMNQLNHEGWLHHVGRHAVSSFLTRGDLWISWEDGLKVFDSKLLDADWSVCAGNWMWVSSSAFENCLQCPVCFSPVIYGMKMDPSGEYVRRYVPVLKNMPLRYLFQPWKAPLEIQQKAGCIVGKDYPRPIVDHKQASKACKQAMENVKAVLKDPAIHCAPSDMQEVRKFCWLPDKMPDGGQCSADFLCKGIESM